jgi:hypothetical protein
MSLIDSKYVEGTRAGRHGAHYYAKDCGRGLVPCMTLYNDDIKQDDKICPNCLRTAFDSTAKVCVRCGSEM